MNAPAKIAPETSAPIDPLAKMREPFPDHQISKLPKETGAQAKQRKADQEAGKWPAKCPVCEGFHHPRAVHLDYVGHAALTDRLLDTDPNWSWEPVALGPDGLPALDRNGGLWIRLTVCGVTRLGYGDADGKTGGNAVKEAIGDALRNAAMRFGAALDLWHKGDLHVESEESAAPTRNAADMAIQLLRGCGDAGLFKEAWAKNFEGWKQLLSPDDYKRVQAVKAEIVAKFVRDADEAKAREPKPDPAGAFDITDDEIPF